MTLFLRIAGRSEASSICCNIGNMAWLQWCFYCELLTCADNCVVQSVVWSYTCCALSAERQPGWCKPVCTRVSGCDSRWLNAKAHVIIVRQSLHGVNLSQKSQTVTENAHVVHNWMYANMQIYGKMQCMANAINSASASWASCSLCMWSRM